MSQELTLNSNIRFLKGGVDSGQISFASNVKQTITGTRMIHTAQSIGFAARELLQLGELANVGYLEAINRDATNFIELFLDASTGAAFAKLKAGDSMRLPANGNNATPAAKADTTACLLEFIAVEQ